MDNGGDYHRPHLPDSTILVRDNCWYSGYDNRYSDDSSNNNGESKLAVFF